MRPPRKKWLWYFQMKGIAYASDASTDLQLDYELVCTIMDDRELEGKMETIERAPGTKLNG